MKRRHEAESDGSNPGSGTGFQPVSKDLIVKRRDLPHWQVGGAVYFLTFRLSRGQPPLSERERAIVKDAVLFWHSKKWHVYALTIMPDHAHILAQPLQIDVDRWHSLSEVLHSVKRHTARLINAQRQQTGSLWQSETFDRIIRNGGEYDEKATYIFNNAVKAGLVEDGWEYDGFWCDPSGE
jgi:putative transposase